MITEKSQKDIIDDLNQQAEDKLARYKMYQNEYDLGTANGLRTAISIIRKHQLLANPE